MPNKLRTRQCPTQFLQLTSTPFPVLSLLDLAWKTIKNTSDETRDAVFGEDSKQDKTPVGYYSSQWVPGVMQMRRFIEIYDQDKKNPFKAGI